MLKSCCRKISLILLLFALLVPGTASAELKEFIVEATYVMDDGENPSVAGERAFVEARRKAISLAGTHLGSIAAVKKMELTRNEIWAYSYRMLETSVLDKKSGYDGKSAKYWIKIRGTINSGDIGSMRYVKLDKINVETYLYIYANYENLQQEAAALKRRISLAATIQEKQEIGRSLAQNERAFSAVRWFDKGLGYLYKRYYHGAVVACTKAVESDPQNAYAYYYRGYAYKATGQTALAVTDYTKALLLDPRFAAAYLDRGNLYDDTGRYDLAIADYNQTILLDPQYALAYCNRGNTYAHKKQYDLAIADYTTSIRLDPLDAESYYLRGVALKKNGQEDSALADYTMAIRVNPRFANAYYNRGLIYCYKRQFDLGIADFSKAIELNPRDGDAYYNRAKAYDDTGQYELAIADLNQVIRLNPRDAYAYYNRACALVALGRTREALADYESSIQYATPGDRVIEETKQRIRELNN